MSDSSLDSGVGVRINEAPMNARSHEAKADRE